MFPREQIALVPKVEVAVAITILGAEAAEETKVVVVVAISATVNRTVISVRTKTIHPNQTNKVTPTDSVT